MARLTISTTSQYGSDAGDVIKNDINAGRANWILAACQVLTIATLIIRMI
jgi:hypothetical protein